MQSNTEDLSALNHTYYQVEQYRDLDRQIKALTAQKEAIGKELKCGFFLHHTDFIFEGRLIATYRPSITIRFNQARFKADMLELFESYQEAVEEKRFLLK